MDSRDLRWKIIELVNYKNNQSAIFFSNHKIKNLYNINIKYAFEYYTWGVMYYFNMYSSYTLIHIIGSI